jgi:integrase
MADRLSKKKARTVKTNYASFLRLVRWLTTYARGALVLSDPHGFNWSDLSEGIVRAFLEWSVKHTAEKGHDFFCLRTFYEWGVARSYPDFQRDLLNHLKTVKAPSNAKGHHVRFRHPIKGPFSPDELFQIRKALQAKKGTDQDRAIIMLHLELGLNPYASMQITNADFKRYETEHLVAYQIDVPRIKKRTVHRETKRRPVSHTLGQLLEHLQHGDPQDRLLHWLPPSDPRQGIERAMGRFVKTVGIVSPATGTLLKMTPRRFRTSLATYMAAQGASKFHIAEILDHTDLQNVEVYTQTVSSIADQVAIATDPIVQPLVQRFLGKIVDETAEPMDQETPYQQIPVLTPHLPLPMLSVGGIGSCGRSVQKDGLCQLLPPLSCYLCPSFVAFRSGPHQEMLDALLNFRQFGEGMVDGRIKRQLDDVCTAIAEVLAQLGKPDLNWHDGTEVEEKKNTR